MVYFFKEKIKMTTVTQKIDKEEGGGQKNKK